ncbi:UNVERIFIED_CONTAM: hypothetical protein FKN15_071202 [Acipenser sinensis]
MMTEEEEEHCRDYKFNWTEFYDRTSYNLTEMLKSCKFQKQKCTADDFQPLSKCSVPFYCAVVPCNGAF